jgi:cation:H+ antiporter
VTEGFGLGQWIAVFGVAGAALVWAGIGLARAGDEIATGTGVGGLLVGTILIAAATSLPEVVAAVSAAIADAPELAVGDLFGSGMANMAILAVIDLMTRRRLWPSVELGHARVASVAIGLTSLAVLATLTPVGIAIGWVGLDTVGIACAYVLGVAWVRRAGPRPRRDGSGMGEVPVPIGWSGTSADVGRLRAATIRFIFGAVVVFASGPIVAIAAKGIADTSRVGQTFVGVALLAVATSLPELVASIAAVRIGAFDLAVGNLFGSNTINIAMLVIVDMASTRGPLLSAVATPGVITAGVGAILLMALALAAVVHGEETRIKRLEPDAVVLLLAYVGVLIAVGSR